MLESGLLADIDEMVGIHLRPIQEAKMGQATAALCHGSAYVIDATITGLNAHGARLTLASTPLMLEHLLLMLLMPLR